MFKQMMSEPYYALEEPKSKHMKPSLNQLKIDQHFTATFQTIKMLLISMGVEEHHITPDCNLYTDLGLDLLDHTDLIIFTEYYFGIDIDDHSANGAETIDALQRVILSKQQEQHLDSHQNGMSYKFIAAQASLVNES